MPVLIDPNRAKREAAEAARAKAAEAKPDALVKYLDPSRTKNKLRILADESGSMYIHFQDVRDGIVEFLRNCIKDQDSAAIHLLGIPDESNEMSKLNSNLPQLADMIQKARFSGGVTPLFGRMTDCLKAEPRCSRLIVFTDGSPTDSDWNWKAEPASSTALTFRYQHDADKVIALAKEHSIPIDTIFFGTGEFESDAIRLLKYLAELTGGYFLLFDPKKTTLKKALKYLAPVNRLMLASESFRKDVESGRRE